MRRCGRCLAVGLVVLAGCGWATKPLARDPLLRRGQGVWGDSGRPTPAEARRADPPPPPAGPTIGQVEPT